MELNLTITPGNEQSEFKRISKDLMTKWLIKAGGKEYQIVEIEFYYRDQNEHKDPYVHQTDEQLTCGKWYFNGFGLDITCGNKDNYIYGGILIRGVKSFDKENYISGPSNVLKELFSQYDAFTEEKSIYIIKADKEFELKSYEPFASKRIGLTKKQEDEKNYIDVPYRFLTDINLEHKFKDKERVVRELAKTDVGKSINIKDILGYNVKV
jgi:hypothetical protein